MILHIICSDIFTKKISVMNFSLYRKDLVN